MTEKALVTKDSPDQLIEFGEGGMKLTNLQEAYRFAQYVVQANMAPKGDREPAVVVKMAAALSLGLDPVWGLSNMTFTNGRIGIMGDAACAVIRQRQLTEGQFPLIEWRGEPFTEGWTCRVGAVRKGYAEPAWSEFSLADAIHAGLVKLDKGKLLTYKREGGWGDHSAPWSRYPKRMLYYRALGFLVRDHFSDALMGCYVQEELNDFPRPIGRDERRERDVTPPKSPDPLLTATKSQDSSDEQKRAQPEPCPACRRSAMDFKGSDENPTLYMCPNGHEWEPGSGHLIRYEPQASEPEPCSHPDGFSVSSGNEGSRFCIHCGLEEDPSGQGELL